MTCVCCSYPVCTQIGTAKNRYEVGLNKLANTETSVAAMQVRSMQLECGRLPVLLRGCAVALASGHARVAGDRVRHWCVSVDCASAC
jgi:hypothetical protein